jgi:hypothetical protein
MSNLHPSLQSLTIGKILSRREGIQEVLYPPYRGRITMPEPLQNTERTNNANCSSKQNQLRHSRGWRGGTKNEKNNYNFNFCAVFSPTFCISVHITHNKRGEEERISKYDEVSRCRLRPQMQTGDVTTQKGTLVCKRHKPPHQPTWERFCIG